MPIRVVPGAFIAKAGEPSDILRHDGAAKAIRIDWREPVPVMKPVLAEAEANLAGITREYIATTVRAGFEGEPTGVYREGDELLPIMFRAAEAERSNTPAKVSPLLTTFC